MQRDLKTRDAKIRELEEEIENKVMSVQLSLDQAKS
jgi:hypothetical protein